MRDECIKKGYRNKVADVKGVYVEHRTIAADNIQTGVMVILPTGDDISCEKPAASYHVINGFGKTGGSIQLGELGILESPIALASTLCVGTVQQVLVRCILQDHPEVGTTSDTVNVVIGECNDGCLNDIRACNIQGSDIYEATADAGKDFTLGTVGADRGMSYFEMKGGIGSTSRASELSGGEYTVGLLVLSNSGLKDDYIKENVSFHDSVKEQVEQGSIIIILAVDVPMSDRQLKHVCKRMPVALACLGSHLGNDSNGIAIAFSAANKIPHSTDRSFISQTIPHEQQIDKVFRTDVEACEEAIQSSLDVAETVAEREGHCRYNLGDTVAKMKKG